PDRWKDLRFLVGEWSAEGGGNPGPAGGGYSLLPELDGKILVRRSVADYPAANGKPATHHEDLLTIFIEVEGKTPEAIYFDTEGHVIHYVVEVDAAAKVARFVSPAQPGQPRYRLTYRQTNKDMLAGQFEVAPPGKPDNFTRY